MSVDSRAVNRMIRREIRPLLKEREFSKFTPRTSWRYSHTQIQVVNFQSFNAYIAQVIGCTTYSFSVNLGIYFLAIPSQFGADSVKKKEGLLMPEEYLCHFRKRLHKDLRQEELPRSDIWYIDPDGRFLEPVFDDVRRVLLQDGLPWFERFSEPSEVLRTLLEDDERFEDTWGFGANPSPIRSYMIGYIALSMARYDLATSALEQALESGCFELVRLQLSEDRNYAAAASR